MHISPTTPSYSPRPHLQQCQNIYFSLIRPQFFFFTLNAEHGHAVGEFVAFGADVGGDVGEVSSVPNCECS